MPGGQEDLQPVWLYAHQRTPPPTRRTEGAQPSTRELGPDVAGHQRIPTVAGGAAKTVGRSDIADRENTAMTGHSQVRRHAHEPVLIKDFRRQPIGVWPHPPDRPEHGVGGSLGLSGAPANGLAGDLVTGEAVWDHRAVPW